MSRTRQEREASGRRGEAQAALYLEREGWQVLDRRVRTPLGEIDLIARRAGMVIFVEVKWRRNAADLDLAIDQRRLRRVAAAVEAVGHLYAGNGDDWRIDVLLLAPGEPPRHIANAWMPF